MAPKKTAKKKTTRKKAKRQRKAPAKPEAAQEKIRQLVTMAYAGNASALWMHDILTEAGYCRKGDRITKEDARRYGKAMGEIFEKLIEHAAETDKELAARQHEIAKKEVDALAW